VYKRASCAAVAVDERMNRFELRVCDRRLNRRRQCVLVRERAEVHKELRNVFVRRRHESGAERIVRSPADPILLGSDLSAVHGEACWGKQPPVYFQDALDRDCATGLDGIRHGIDVRKHFLRCSVCCCKAFGSRSIRAKKTLRGDLQALDAGRRDGFCPEQNPCERFGAREDLRRMIEARGRALSIGDISKYV